MNLEIVSAEMSRKEDKSYVGRTIFTLENHKAPYEITFSVQEERNGITA